MHPPSGAQRRIRHGELSAVVTEVGATLRSLQVGETPVLFGFGEEAMCSGGKGQVLAPWPNRLADGVYAYRGVSGKAALDEPERQNAIHGLVRWLEWRTVGWDERSVELACELAPQPAYPFGLRLSLAYALSDEGLEVRAHAESDAVAAPFGIGFHPYFAAGSAGLSACRLELPATSHLLCDERALPIGSETPVGALASLCDPGGALLGEVKLDDCFCGLRRDEKGQALVSFWPGPGPIEKVSVRLGPAFDYVMCFTGDTLGDTERRRAIAIEPMSCPPNALRSGASLVEIGAGSSFDATFMILVGRA